MRSKPPLNLGKDHILRIFINFAVPSVLAMLAQTTAELIDSIFIGRFVGPEGIAGITLFFPVLNFIVGFNSMIAIGGVTLAGIHHGRGELEVSNNYFNVTLTLVTIASLLSTGATWLLADINFLRGTIGIEDSTSLLTSEYARTLTWFFVPFLLNFLFGFFLKLDGRPIIVVVATVMGTVINIVLDYLFIKVFGMGMRGAAMATGLSQLIPSLLLLGLIILRSTWHFAPPRFVFREIRDMLYNGSSEFLTMSSLAISGFIYNAVILSFVGEAGVASYGIALQAANFMGMLFYGISDGIQSPVSFNFGARNYSRVKNLRRLAMGTVLSLGIVFSWILVFGGGLITSLFTKDTGTAIRSIRILKFFGISFIFAGINTIAITYYTAINQPGVSAGLSVIRSLVGITLGLLILPPLFGELGVWMPVVLTEVVSIICVLIFLTRKPWGLKRPQMEPAASTATPVGESD